MNDGLDIAALQKAANGHSIFAPSAAAMWLACPGSLIANLMHADTAGIDAALGTVAHSVADEWLRTGEEPLHRVGEIVPVQEGKTTFQIEIDLEMMGYVGEYVAWCQELPGDHYTEQRVDLSHLMPVPRQGGTADYLALSPGVLRTRDFKYGVGVQVFAANNPQAQLYALGAFEEWDWLYNFQTIEIGIGQPRLRHFDVWETTREELLAFGEDVREKALLAWRPNAPRVPGPKQCRFCRARKSCEALNELTDRMVDEAFADGPALLQSDTPRLAEIYRWRSLFETRFREIGAELNLRASDGQEVPGYKLVTGRSRRAWFDEDAIPMFLESTLGDEMWTRELLSPAQAEKALRKQGLKRKEVQSALAGLIETKPGRQTLVAEGDPRPDEENATDQSFEYET